MSQPSQQTGGDPTYETRDLAREGVEAAKGQNTSNEDREDVSGRQSGKRQRMFTIFANVDLGRSAKFRVDTEETDTVAEYDRREHMPDRRIFSLGRA